MGGPFFMRAQSRARKTPGVSTRVTVAAERKARPQIEDTPDVSQGSFVGMWNFSSFSSRFRCHFTTPEEYNQCKLSALGF